MTPTPGAGAPGPPPPGDTPTPGAAAPGPPKPAPAGVGAAAAGGAGPPGPPDDGSEGTAEPGSDGAGVSGRPGGGQEEPAGALAPADELAGLWGAAAGLVGAARAANTRTAYASDWVRFAGWCDRRGLSALPATPATLGAYLTAAATDPNAAGYTPATLARWVAAVNFAHRRVGHPAPGAHPHVGELLAGIRREHGRPPARRDALVTADLRAILAGLPRSGWPGVVAARRDACLLVLGFARPPTDWRHRPAGWPAGAGQVEHEPDLLAAQDQPAPGGDLPGPVGQEGELGRHRHPAVTGASSSSAASTNSPSACRPIQSPTWAVSWASLTTRRSGSACQRRNRYRSVNPRCS
jgi:hypothetical protein